MTNEEIKELEERTYAISWSGFPINTLFNDIRDNDHPRFNKYLVYQDFKKIIDEIYRLKDKAEKYDDKETPKKPIFVDTRFRKRGRLYGECSTLEECYKCPNCNLHIFYDLPDYRCQYCGQALDWSDEDE